MRAYHAHTCTRAHAHPPHTATGIKLLARAGVIPNGGAPAAAAAFLRQHSALLDKGQMGELFGGHEEWEVEVRGAGACV